MSEANVGKATFFNLSEEDKTELIRLIYRKESNKAIKDFLDSKNVDITEHNISDFKLFLKKYIAVSGNPVAWEERFLTTLDMVNSEVERNGKMREILEAKIKEVPTEERGDIAVWNMLIEEVRKYSDSSLKIIELTAKLRGELKVGVVNVEKQQINILQLGDKIDERLLQVVSEEKEGALIIKDPTLLERYRKKKKVMV